MKRNIKIRLAITLTLTVIAFCILFILNRDLPPTSEIKEARKALSDARMCSAERYASKLYYLAENTYDSSMLYWNIENKRFWLSRDYDKVRELAADAKNLAIKSKEHAQENTVFVEQILGQELHSLQTRIGNFQSYFDRLPLSEKSVENNQMGLLMLKEAEIAFSKSDFLLANSKLKSAQKNITISYSDAEKIIANYFTNYPDWERSVRKTIEGSEKEKACCIVVDKFSRECLVYHSGILKERFDIELGKNWIGDKNHQGDKSTPEGYYYVENKFDEGQTRYYKALLLNYPNESDKKRFKKNQKKGIVPSGTGIGSLIEIHGHGGKGADWTDGCIALRDSDMKILFPICPRGTPVTIVGSVKPLHELIH